MLTCQLRSNDHLSVTKIAEHNGAYACIDLRGTGKAQDGAAAMVASAEMSGVSRDMTVFLASEHEVRALGALGSTTSR